MLTDISLCTELEAIIKLSEAAQEQVKKHEVIIMVDLGELREGVMPGGMMELYLQASQLPGITVAGFGTYFSRAQGLDYIYRKLIQLVHCQRTLEEKFNTSMRLCSAGTSIVIPNLTANRLPASINHFRVGESLFLGSTLISGGTIDGLRSDGFRLAASILELKDKPAAFTGEIPEDCESGYQGKKAVRVVLDVGELDVPVNHLKPVDEKVKILNAATDLLVVDLSETGKSYRLGEEIDFDLDYHALLSLMHSRYVKKEMVQA
jgi:predicted amino acid racemase